MKSDVSIIIKAGSQRQYYWNDLIRYKELLFFFAWKDILVRYKQTVIGILWSLLRPLMTMVVLTIVFGKLAKLPAGNVPYPLLVLAGILPWQLFASSFHSASESVLINSKLITKVFFPRILLPLSAAVVSVIDFLISFVILIVMMIAYGYIPTWRILAIIPLVGLTLIASMGIGFWLSALNVRYRDFRYIIPFFVQFGLYVSPVGFMSSIVPDHYRLLYSLNPMAGVIDGFRWALLGQSTFVYMPGLILSIVVSVVAFVAGGLFFISTEQEFADVI